MTRAAATAMLVWAALAMLAAIIIARASYTTDLSAFLPRAPSDTQRLLVEQLREGIASRLILVGIAGADPAERARICRAMANRLRASQEFVSVNNGEPAGLDRERQLLFAHRYLLSETVTRERFTAQGLHAAIEDSLDLLASPAGLLLKSLLPRDPTGEMVQILDQLGNRSQPPLVEGAWASRDGRRALLVAQTRAAGSDTDGQEHAIATIRQAFEAARRTASNPGVGSEGASPPGPASRAAASRPLPASPGEASAPAYLEMSGPGVFSVAARATIKHSVTQLSIVSTLLIALLLLCVYRSFPALVLGLVPVVSGALAGVAAVALGFGAVHGITLGFGVTLIGESVDYSIYLFVQSQQQPRAMLWSTIRLGVLTSVVGFSSLVPSGFPGLAQLGVFSTSGLLAAALVTRFVLPNLLPARLPMRDLTPFGTALATGLQRVRAARVLLIAPPLLAAVVLYAHRDTLWNRELAALSPISPAEQRLDSLLRSDLGAPDVSYLVVASGADMESALQAAQSLGSNLDELIEQGVIAGFDSPARYLPSLRVQRERQASLPDSGQLRRALTAALVDLPIRVERLEPFLRDVEAARTQPLLRRADLQGTTLAAAVDALLVRDANSWSALLPLRVPTTVAIDVDRVHSAIRRTPLGQGVQAVVLDVKREADRLYSTYLSEAVRLSLAGFAAILVLLVIALRSLGRAARIVVPLILAVLSVAAVLVLLGVQLTILHLIGMLLIVAVGSNYALFFDRQAASHPLALASLVIANAATVLGFGVLGFSSVPVLSALGETVAPGAALALIFSALLARGQPAAAS